MTAMSTSLSTAPGPNDLYPQQSAGLLVGDELGGKERRVRVIMRLVVRDRQHRDGVVSRFLGLPLGQAGAAAVQARELDDAGYPAHLGRSCPVRRGPAASVRPSRLAEEPIGDHCRRPVSRFVTMTRRRRRTRRGGWCGGIRPQGWRPCTVQSRWRPETPCWGRMPADSTTSSAGSVLPPACTAVTLPSPSSFSAPTPVMTRTPCFCRCRRT